MIGWQLQHFLLSVSNENPDAAMSDFCHVRTYSRTELRITTQQGWTCPSLSSFSSWSANDGKPTGVGRLLAMCNKHRRRRRGSRESHVGMVMNTLLVVRSSARHLKDAMKDKTP